MPESTRNRAPESTASQDPGRMATAPPPEPEPATRSRDGNGARTSYSTQPLDITEYLQCYSELQLRVANSAAAGTLHPSSPMYDEVLPVTRVTAILYGVRLPGPTITNDAWADAIKTGWPEVFPGVSCTSVSWFANRGPRSEPSFRLEFDVPLDGPHRPERIFLTPLLLTNTGGPSIRLGSTTSEGTLPPNCFYARPDTRLNTIFSIAPLPGDFCKRAWYSFARSMDPTQASNALEEIVIPYLTQGLASYYWRDPSSKAHPRFLIQLQDVDAMHAVHKRFYCCLGPWLPHLRTEDGDDRLSRLAVNSTRISTDVAARAAFLAFEGYQRLQPRQTPVYAAIPDRSTPVNTVISLLEAIKTVGMLRPGTYGLSHFSVHQFRNSSFVDFRLNPITSTGSSHESAILLVSTMARLITLNVPAPLTVLDPAIQWNGDRLHHGSAVPPFRNRCPLCKMSMKHGSSEAYYRHVSFCAAPQGNMASCHRCKEEDHTIVQCSHVPRDPKLNAGLIEAFRHSHRPSRPSPAGNHQRSTNSALPQEPVGTSQDGVAERPTEGPAHRRATTTSTGSTVRPAFTHDYQESRSTAAAATSLQVSPPDTDTSTPPAPAKRARQTSARQDSPSRPPHANKVAGASTCLRLTQENEDTTPQSDIAPQLIHSSRSVHAPPLSPQVAPLGAVPTLQLLHAPPPTHQSPGPPLPTQLAAHEQH